MKLFILVALLTFTTLYDYAYAGSKSVLATPQEVKRVLVDPAKPQLNLSLLQRYNIHAQCARLAYWAGYTKLIGQHMAATQELRPKSVPASDLAYRFGFIDGQITAIQSMGPKRTYKQIAKRNYSKVCPIRM